MFNTKVFSSLLMAMALLAIGTVSQVTAQGRYANQYSRNDVNNIIQRLEESSNSFRTDFRSEMDRSPINGTPQEDRYNQMVASYENSLDRLRKRFDRGDTWWQSRNEVQRVVNDAQPVNDMMNTIQFRRNLERQWNRMRNDLNKLADTYDLPGLNGGGWTGGNNGGWNGGNNGGNWNQGGNWGGQTSRPPSWAVGTFYSTNSGDNIALTIDANGRVTVVNNGQTFYGGFYRDTITVNNDTSDLRQTRNGIQTYNRSTGQTTNYTRNAGGYPGGGYPGGGYGGQTSRPPSWAVGTFYSINSGDNIVLTINENGSVTVVNNGQTFYGGFYRNTITVNNDTSDLRQTRNGIQTYNRSTNQTTNYSRNGGINPGGGYPGGGNVSTPPSWAQGTFYSTSGSQITMTIGPDGRISLYTGGQTYYGTFYQNTMTLNGDVSTVSQTRNGIRTYNQRTGESTDYRRR